VRESSRYLLIGREGAARPDRVQAAWLYAQMVRWGQASISAEALGIARAVFRPDLYDAVLGLQEDSSSAASGVMGAFAGPPFDAEDVGGYLDALRIAHRRS
jgi:NitT/TauT family transport system ATP-binding protein